MSNYVVTKTFSDNPFIDAMLYYTKKLAFGAVIKNGQIADSMETKDSLKNADKLIMCMEGNIRYETCSFGYSDMVSVGVDENLAKGIALGAKNPMTGLEYTYDDIPDLYKEPLRQLAIKTYIRDYVELNDYYRMLCGLPNIGDYGIPIRDYEYLLPDGNIWNATYVHEIGADGAKLLETYGILDMIKNDYPNAKYLDYILCDITPYKARKAYDFQLLYLPPLEDNDTIADQFRRVYEDNRIYVEMAVYSEAYKYNSDYYSNFICLLILLLTMTDMLAKIQENILRMELLDQRCVECLFEQYGMDYYKSIPLKYQQRICKNLNKLIHNKSTAQGMFDIVNLFGAENITIFRYFILRDRKLDKWGNFIYNEIATKKSKYNEWVEYVRLENKIKDPLIIPYPFEHYLEKGNVMFIWLKKADGSWERLEKKDYEVTNYDHLIIKNGKANNIQDIRYDFYYDVRTKSSDGYAIDTTNSLMMQLQVKLLRDNQFTYELPTNTYLSEGNEFIVFLTGEPLQKDAFTIDYAERIITLHDSFRGYTDRDIFILYLWNSRSGTKFVRTDVKAEFDNQKIFLVPEPFPQYCVKGNSFFVSYDSTFISSKRYKIVDEKYIEFDDTSFINIGHKVSFNFIYSVEAVFTNIEMEKESEVLEITQDLQIEFKLHPPFDNYFKTGYKAYVKINGVYLEQDWYQTYHTTLSFNSKSIGARKGKDKVEVIYVYGPHGADAANISSLTKQINITTNNQTVFTNIPFPEEKFLTHKGAVIVDVNGRYIPSSGYTLDEDTKVLTITDPNVTVESGKPLNLLFIYQLESERKIKITEDLLEVEQDGQSTFNLTLPFHPYFETKQGILLYYHTLLINPDDIVINGTSITIRNHEFKKGHVISVLYLFNNIFLLEAQEKIIVEEKHCTSTDIVNNNLQLTIPIPFPDFIQHNWPWFVSSNGKYIDPSLYEVIDDNLTFKDPNDVLKYQNLTFTFLYLNDQSIIYDVYTEDVNKDFELKFVGVPLDEEYFINGIMKKENILQYDMTALGDRFWDGVGSEDDIFDAHLRVKKQILEKKFNYERTKYFGINYKIDIADLSFQVSYLFSLLYDDYFVEQDLNIDVPNISTAKKFNIGYIFCYLTSLAYLYSGIDDTIMDTPSKIMYVKGFNMRADIPALKEGILKARQTLAKYPVWNFIIPETRLKTMEEFLHQYQTNKSVYITIGEGMHNAGKYRDYKIWKNLYDSLMTWQFNLLYFHLNSTGKVAPSFRAFLEEKDHVMYNSIRRIENIKDKYARRETIANHISDIVYLLENYFSGYEFHHLFDRYPGASKISLLNYAFSIINFFKSYKVALNSKGNYIIFTNKDPYLNSVRPVDDVEENVILDKPEYIRIRYNLIGNVHTNKKDSIGVHDRLMVVKRTEPSKDIKHVKIIQSDHQHITVEADDTIYTTDFDIAYGTLLNLVITADKGWIAGELNTPVTVITKDLTIFATAAKEDRCTVYIVNPPHQKITVYERVINSDGKEVDGNKHTETFTIGRGFKIRVDIDAEFGHTPGNLSFYSGTVDTDITVTATEATRESCIVNINEIAPHQHFKLRIFNDDSDPSKFDEYIAYSEITALSNYKMGINSYLGAKYICEIVPDEGYEASTLKNGLSLINQFMTPVTEFSLTEAKRKEIHVIITQKANETISVTCNGEKYTDSFTGTYGQLYDVSIKADTGYAAGNLVIKNTSGTFKPASGILKEDLNITAYAARTPKKCKVTIAPGPYQKITVYADNHEYTSSFEILEGTEYYSTIESIDNMYEPGKLINGQGTIKRNTIISATPAKKKKAKVHIKQSPNETIYIDYKGEEYKKDFEAEYGEYVTSRIVANPGFTAGTVSPSGSYLIMGDVTFTATAAIPGNQTIKVINPLHDKEFINVTLNGTNVKVTEANRDISCLYGDIYKIGTELYDKNLYKNPTDIKVTKTGTNQIIGTYGTAVYDITADTTGFNLSINRFKFTLHQQRGQSVRVEIYDEHGNMVSSHNGEEEFYVYGGQTYRAYVDKWDSIKSNVSDMLFRVSSPGSLNLPATGNIVGDLEFSASKPELQSRYEFAIYSEIFRSPNPLIYGFLKNNDRIYGSENGDTLCNDWVYVNARRKSNHKYDRNLVFCMRGFGRPIDIVSRVHIQALRSAGSPIGWYELGNWNINEFNENNDIEFKITDAMWPWLEDGLIPERDKSFALVFEFV